MISISHVALGFVLPMLTLVFSTTDSGMGPAYVQSTAQDDAGRYFSLSIGRVWYYKKFDYRGILDDGLKYDQTRQVVDTVRIGDSVYFKIQATYFHVQGQPVDMLEGYYRWASPTILESVSLTKDGRKASCCTYDFEARKGMTRAFECGGMSLIQRVSDKTDTTITFEQWSPRMVDSRSEEVYKKNVGLHKSTTAFGIGIVLVDYR